MFEINYLTLLFQTYKEDSFGLKTLASKNRIYTYTKAGITHRAWKRNAQVIRDFILPHLG